MPSIIELLPVKPVIPKNFSKATQLESPNPGLVMGVEFEIENCRFQDTAEDLTVPGVRVTTDGSLRNNGYEFITAPMTYNNLVYTIELFYGKNKWNADNFSERCSTHVHVNCQNLQLDTLANICLLYQTFEKLLYNFADPERYNNIFCVPWKQTLLPEKLVDAIRSCNLTSVKQWQKYTGLNLNPLRMQGTIEFRHFPGCVDREKFYNWLKILGHLFAYSERNSYDSISNVILNLNTTSAYDNFVDAVFQQQAPLFKKIPDYQSLLADDVLFSKFLLEHKFTEEKKKPTVPLDLPANFATGVAQGDAIDWLRGMGFLRWEDAGLRVGNYTGRLTRNARGMADHEIIIIRNDEVWFEPDAVEQAPRRNRAAQNLMGGVIVDGLEQEPPRVAEAPQRFVGQEAQLEQMRRLIRENQNAFEVQRQGAVRGGAGFNWNGEVQAWPEFPVAREEDGEQR